MNIDNIDMTPYIQVGYSMEECDIIRKAILDKLDVSKLAEYRYSMEQVKLIVETLYEFNANFDCLFNPSLSYEHMELVLQIFLLAGDYIEYSNPKYSIEEVMDYLTQIAIE